MKLQRQIARIEKGKPLYKWVLVIPPSVIKKAGWKKGDVLNVENIDGKIVISKS